jgi:hypothetical protein
MPGCVFLWALPAGWEQFELCQPDVEEQIAARIRQRFSDGGLEPSAADGLVAMEVASARQARSAGVLVWAVYGKGAGTKEDPLSLLSLTLALRELPDGEPTAQDVRAAASRSAPGSNGRVEAIPFPASVTPLALDDRTLCGFIRELRTHARPPGGTTDVDLFQFEVFVAPRAGGMLAALSVTTPDPAWHGEARTVAREVANTLAFIPVETELT